MMKKTTIFATSHALVLTYLSDSPIEIRGRGPDDFHAISRPRSRSARDDEAREMGLNRDECARCSPRVILTEDGPSVGRTLETRVLNDERVKRQNGRGRRERRDAREQPEPRHVVRLFSCLLSTDTAPPNGPLTQAVPSCPLLIDPRRVAPHGRGPRGLTDARCPQNNLVLDMIQCVLKYPDFQIFAIISYRLPKKYMHFY